ncbi:hypothetical protein BT96DRAFT_985756 [Gymnopus androsaceus JB14]|uniref:Uncharacterized protein n=1 Tax=Gymnopus androsaceus JB14 TaxID=1447944 RepID=A0A6A4ICU0_9AGAR|nr:hypothetical protein BT96DRAFT_985756 [Gymnopus androsaceus JB14]
MTAIKFLRSWFLFSSHLLSISLFICTSAAAIPMSLSDLLATTETVICTLAVCSTFKEKPVETETLWNIQVPSSFLIKGESNWRISTSQLLDSVISQLLVEYIGDPVRFDSIVKCFQNAKHTRVATLRVPDFRQNVNLEILGFCAFSGTLEEAIADSPQSYSTTIFSSDEKNLITQSFLSNSPEILMDFADTNNHAHFIILLQPLEEIDTLPSTLLFGPMDFPAEPLPAEYSIPEFSAESLSSGIQASPSPSPDLAHLETFREYLFYLFQQDIESGVYSQEGRTRRKLWFGIQNHRSACQILTQVGFTNFVTTNDEEFFELPNGTRLSMSHILISEMRWDMTTFRRKSRLYSSCAQYAISHCWSSDLLPLSSPPPIKGTREWRDWNERRYFLKIWKRIVAMFSPEGYASFAKPPIASGHIKETFAAELTESNLAKFSKIKGFLVPRGVDTINSWF